MAQLLQLAWELRRSSISGGGKKVKEIDEFLTRWAFILKTVASIHIKYEFFKYNTLIRH